MHCARRSATYHQCDPKQVLSATARDGGLAHAFAALLNHDATLLFNISPTV